MNYLFEIAPYKSVGDILFGISKADVIGLFGSEPDRETVGFAKRISLDLSRNIKRPNMPTEVRIYGKIVDG